MLGVPLNPNGRPNSDVVRPWVNGLDLAHRKPDVAVFAAYCWPATLSDGEIVSCLLALNLERSSRGNAG